MIVMAPTGFGKTVLGSQWAAKYPAITAWYTASPDDSAQTVIFHWVAAIRRLVPGFAPWVNENTDIEAMGGTAISRLCNEISTFDHNLNFVYDGLDQLDPAITPLIQAWINELPLNTKSLSLRQTISRFSHPRAENMRTLQYLTSGQLKFEKSEIDYLTRAHGLDPENPHVKTTISDLDGWPIGIQMALVDLNNNNNKNNNNNNNNNKSEHWQNLISRVCLHLPEESRLLLEKISLLKSISILEIDALGLTRNSMTTLRELELYGIFLEKISEEPLTYKVKDLFKKFLLPQAKDASDALLNFSKLASNYFLSNSNFAEAIEILELVGEEKEAMRLTSQYILELLLMGDRGIFFSRLMKLENQGVIGVVDSMYLQAAFEIASGNIDRAIVLHKNLYQKLIDNEGFISAELNLLEIKIAFFLGDYEKVIKLTRKAPTLPNTVSIEASTHVLSSFRSATSAAFLLEDDAVTLEILDLAQKEGTDKPLIINAVTLPCMRALAFLTLGRLHEAREESLFALANAEKFQLKGNFFPYEAVYCLADIYRESGDYAKAEELINTHLVGAFKFHQWPWITALRSKLALIVAQQGRSFEALEIIKVTRDEVSQNPFNIQILRIVDEHELLIRTVLHDVERVGELLYRMPSTQTTTAYKTAFAARQNKAKAEQILDSIPSMSPRERLMKALITADVHKDSPKVALKALQEATEIATENGFRTIFLMQSDQTRENLLELAGKRPTIYLELLARDIRKLILDKKFGSNPTNLDLTRRELEILRRLSTGLPISQIAATLHISNNTIKTHLKSLYRKLGVDSRKSAVAKGSELALL